MVVVVMEIVVVGICKEVEGMVRVVEGMRKVVVVMEMVEVGICKELEGM